MGHISSWDLGTSAHLQEDLEDDGEGEGEGEEVKEPDAKKVRQIAR